MTGIAFPGLAQAGISQSGISRRGEAGLGLGFIGGRGGAVVPSGSAIVGQTLTASSGASYQWIRQGGLVIPGATSQTYVPGVLDVGIPLSCKVGGVPMAYTPAIAGIGTFADDFNRANAQLAANTEWTIIGDPTKMNIVSNQLSVSLGAQTCIALSKDIGTINHFVQVTYISGAYMPRLIARGYNFNNYVYTRYTTSNSLTLNKVSGSALTPILQTATNLGTFATTLSPGDVVRLEVNGDTATVLVNGAIVIGPISGLANEMLANLSASQFTKVGLANDNAAGVIDDFSAGPLGAVVLPATRPLAMACYGDSQIGGQGASTSPSTNATLGPAGLVTFDPPSRLRQLSNARLCWQGGISGQTTTQILGRVRSENPRFGRTYILEGAHNDIAGGVGWPATAAANIAAMVAQVDAASEGRYVIISCPNSQDPTEAAGQPEYTRIKTFNATLAATYPTKYLDIWSTVIVAAGAPGGAYPDPTFYPLDQPPTGLLKSGDIVHCNDAGYALYTQAIWNFLVAQGWELPL